jgi:hypothetical protein
MTPGRGREGNSGVEKPKKSTPELPSLLLPGVIAKSRQVGK